MDAVIVNGAINTIRSALEDYFENNIASDDHEDERQELAVAWSTLMQYMQYQREHVEIME